MTIPVTNDESPEVHPLLQYVGQKRFVAVQFLAMKAVVRGHHGLRAASNSGNVAGGVDVAKHSFADLCVALIFAVGGAAIADIVFD